MTVKATYLAILAGNANDQIKEASTAAKQHHKNVISKPGNSKVNQTDTHRLLAPERHQTWINIDGNTVFDNPTKTFHTMMNTIQHIKLLDRLEPLVKSIWVFSETKDIILTPGDKPLKELLSCKKPEQNPILIVAVATKYAHEEGNKKLPWYHQFTVLMLLFQEEPHFIILSCTTNMNLHLGKMIQNKDLWKKN